MVAQGKWRPCRYKDVHDMFKPKPKYKYVVIYKKRQQINNQIINKQITTTNDLFRTS